MKMQRFWRALALAGLLATGTTARARKMRLRRCRASSRSRRPN
ncbi:hypothetical protein BURCENK562V_C7312 [Burkholderia cenocepacia K56-2Valvano]|nr:hypothetical protein BURCENK562V_C7312 [Burkholderia cenocepacia K56-2Valvano]